jgi:hypothetical protein
MPTTQNQLQKETGVSIDRFVVLTGTGNQIDLTLQLQELNIFEDLFSPTISGTASITDALNLLEKMSICGQEWVFIRISKPGFETEDGDDVALSLLLRIYKIERVDPHNPLRLSYLMHLCKEDLILSHEDRVCKSFVNTKPEFIIKNIFQNSLFYDSEDAFEEAFATWPISPATPSALTCVIPNLKPLDAVAYVAASTRGENGIHDYLFYENSAGYNFESLSNMFKKDTVLRIKYKVKNVQQVESSSISTNDPYINSLSPIKLQSDVLFDYLTSLQRGEFGAQADVFDFSKQKFISKSISYNQFLKDYKKDFTLNKYSKVPKNDWVELSPDGSRIPYYRTFSVVGAYGSVTNSTADRAAEGAATRALQLASISNQKVKLHMPGTPILKVGSTLKLEYPSISSKSKDDSSEELLDRYLAAKYLITAVRHVITSDSWDSYCELSKDTLPNELPENFSSNFTLEGL